MIYEYIIEVLASTTQILTCLVLLSSSEEKVPYMADLQSKACKQVSLKLQ